MDVAVAAGRDAAQQMAAQAAAAETRVVLLQWRAEQERRAARQAQGATLHQNSQLLRELQVGVQGRREGGGDRCRYPHEWVLWGGMLHKVHDGRCCGFASWVEPAGGVGAVLAEAAQLRRT